MRARLFCAALGLCLLLSVAPRGAAAQTQPPPAALPNDALTPPPPPPSLAGVDNRGPSQYLAGSVAVRVVLPESAGHAEDWSAAQIGQIRAQIQSALDWWAARLPLAHLRFTLQLQVVPTAYEPNTYGLADEGRWIGDVLTHMGYAGGSYFDQAYAADADLRDTLHTDWASTIFVANSLNAASGYFPDGHFAYAYINGPFMVLTSDVGAYGADRMAPVMAHEFAHLFGALDQYAAARVDCVSTSGYLNTATTNSQYNGCGTRLPSIMIETIDSFSHGLIDPSALAQVGYRDSDGDGLIDPLDTTPGISLNPITAAAGGRPILSGQSADVGFPSPYQTVVSINQISAVEYRVNGGAWQAATAADAAFDSAAESFTSEMPLYDGDYRVEVRARNSAGVSSAISSLDVSVRQVGPQPAYRPAAPALTASPAVSVQLDAPPTTRAVQISADPGFSGAAWQPYAPSLPFQLSPQDGAQTIYVRYQDDQGRASLAYALPVRLDTTPPQGSATRDPAHADRLLLQAHDDGAGVADVGIEVGDGAPLWLPFQADLQLDGAGTLGAAGLQADATMSVRFRDAAGNVSPAYAVTTSNQVFLPLIAR